MFEEGAAGFFTVELYLDQESEATIVSLHETIAGRLGRTPPPVRPHLTLGGCKVSRGVTDVSAFQAIGAGAAGAPITFGSVGIFPGERSVLYLTPVVTEALLALHRRVDEQIQGLALPMFELYRPGRWVPHCTLAMDLAPPELEAALCVAAQSPLPLTATVSTIDVRDYPAAMDRGSA